MRAPIFRGTVLKGSLKLDNRNGFKELIESLEGKRIEIVLRERTGNRTERQSAYYFSVVVQMIADYLGYTKAECHETLKKQFNIKTTTKLTTKEFQEYIDTVVRFAAQEFHVNIPDPESVEF
jgi:hypothetical protein